MDRIVTDPIISTENATFSPSPSPSPTALLSLPLAASETTKPFYRARPLWLVPFALGASIARGMTLAPRLEVLTELSCRQLHDPYNHTLVHDAQSAPATIHHSSDLTSLYLPSLPRAQSFPESEGDGISEGDDPRVVPGNKCVSDPAVQAAAARLQTIMTTTMGTLSALTTGWWGHFGERHGRTRVLAISTLSLFLTDLTFILVSTPRNPFSTHSHKLLVLAPIVEGFLGGWSALTSATTAYIADCTSPGSRATIFARFTGVLSVGLALGPIIGAWLIRNPISFLKVGQADHPLQSVNSVFWVAICGSFVNILLVLFVFPESLPASRRAMNRKGKNRAIEDDATETNTKDTLPIISVAKSFLSPLTEFLPAEVPVDRQVGMPSRALTHKDWSLTFLALSLFFYVLASGLFQIKYLYAEHVYDWAAEQLSYYISFVGAIRAFHLLVFLPFLLLTLKPVRAATSSAVSLQPGTKAKPTRSRLFYENRFDLVVIRCSMLVDFCSHALVVLCPLPSNDTTSAWWSQTMFIGATSLACAGAGVIPAAQSFALCILHGRKLAENEESARVRGIQTEQNASPESGKLFGAIAVLQAVAQTIIGPILFGVIYSNTVASFPKAIFITAGFLVIVAIVFTTFIRLDVSLLTPRTKTNRNSASRRRAEERRGRSRASKDLRTAPANASYGATTYGPGVYSTRTEAGTSGACSPRHVLDLLDDDVLT